jgi:NADPH-dependent 2,4-dienoyl-CoA reductase/sulfur reductase-like enzyme
VRANVPGIDAATSGVAIEYRGRPLAGRPGDSVAAVLVDAGQLACRIAADGDPRGVFCGMGVCHECLVTIDGVPGRRACVEPVRDGMRIEPQPARPAIEAVAPAPVLARQELAPDVLVVGGGPAGLAAAAAAAEVGVQVTLIDERPKLGGQYFKQPADGRTLREHRLDRQFREGRALIERVHRVGVNVLAGTEVWSATAPDELHAASPAARLTLRPRRLVLATGAFERGVPLPGWTLPGVTATGAAQTLLRAYQVVPGRRVLVSGNGPLNMQVAAELARCGVTVVALAELARATDPRRAAALARMLVAAPGLIRDGAAYRWALRRRHVPVLFGSAVVRVEGRQRVERAVVARVDDRGRVVAGTEREFEVDAVCVGFGFSPANELARALGCRHGFDDRSGHLAAVTDDRGRSTVDGVWVVGDGAGVAGARVAHARGHVAGADAATELRGGLPAPLERSRRAAEREARRHDRFQAALWSVFAAPRLVDELAEPGTPICRCEGVAHATVTAVLDEGVEAIGAVKRATRAGMGGCQGRYCGALLAEMSARRSGRPLDEHDWFAPSAPFKPLAVGAIAAAAGAGEG